MKKTLVSTASHLVAAAISLAVVSGSALAQSAADRSGAAFVKGRVLAMPRPGLPDAALARLLRDHGASSSRKAGAGGLRIVDVAAGAEQALIERLNRHPHMKFAELDRLVKPGMVTNDPYFASEWHLSKTGADLAWDQAMGSGITVAILDTGVDSSHPDLAPSIVPGWNVYDNNSNTADVYGHGTKVAGTVGGLANNGIGVAGVAGRARIMPVRISDSSGWATYSAMAAGITWAADHGARVANISYVAAGSSAVMNAASYMKSKGGLVTTAAGNDGLDAGIAPSNTLIPVSATNSSDTLTSWSSFGAFVALSAPGEGIQTTLNGGGYGSVSGTSFASPITAGTIALMMSARPDLSASAIESALYNSAVDLGATGRDPYFGYGRVNAAAAVAAALGTSTAKADTQAPAVSIAAPLGASVVSGMVAVDVGASDNVGVSRVDLLVNGRVYASDTVAPYGFSVDTTALANGNSTLSAVAYDAAGNAGTSAAVLVTVANITTVLDTTPPTAQISRPTDGSPISGNVSVLVAATDNLGTAGLSQTLFIDGKAVGRASGGTLTYSWNTRKVAAGRHTVQVQVRDAAGNVGTSAVTVSVVK